MNEIKTGLDAIQQAIYEVLSLSVPGAAAIAVWACFFSPAAAPGLLAWSGRHELVSLIAAYVTGYVVQSASRPVTNFTRTVLAFPVSCARRFSAADRAARSIARFWAKMTRGHQVVRGAHDAATVKLGDLLRDTWERRLGLSSDKRLRDCDALDLAYSTLGAQQQRLSRFRAFVSLCRAMAAVCAAAFWTTLGMVLLDWPPTLAGAGLAIGLWLAFQTFMERADMYDALWKGIVPAQFIANLGTSDAIATATAIRAASELATADVPTARVGTPTAASATAVARARSNSASLTAARDEAPSPTTTEGALGTAPKTGNGELLS